MQKVETEPARTREAEDVISMCIKLGVIPLMLRILEKGCAECSQGNATHAPICIQNAAQCLLKLIPVEEAKALLISEGGIKHLVTIINNDFHPVREGGVAPEITLPAKAACAGVLQWITLPRNYDVHEYRILLGAHANSALPFSLTGLDARVEGTKPTDAEPSPPQPHQGGEAGEGVPHPPDGASPPGIAFEGTPPHPEGVAAVPPQPQSSAGNVPAAVQVAQAAAGAPPATAPATGARRTSAYVIPSYENKPLAEQFQDLQVREKGNMSMGDIPMVVDRLQLVVNAGAIPPLMRLCIPPGGLTVPPDPNAKGGKKGKRKGKKGKEPPLPPGKAEAYQYASGTLRHVSLIDEARDQIRDNQGILAMSCLLSSKVTETRQHAQGCLMNMGTDLESTTFMETARVPKYIEHLSSPHARANNPDYIMSKFARTNPQLRPITAP